MSASIDGEGMDYEDSSLMLYEDGIKMSFSNNKAVGENLLKYLPNYYKKINSTWFDLAKAFQETSKGWDKLTIGMRNGYIFHLANKEQLSYLETMLKVPVDNSLPNAYRAGRLEAKLVRKVTTREVIINIAKQFYPNELNPIIKENEKDYTVNLYFGNMQVLPLDIDIFRHTIINILQADLDFMVKLDVAMSAFTHDQLHIYTHDQLVAYRQSV